MEKENMNSEAKAQEGTAVPEGETEASPAKETSAKEAPVKEKEKDVKRQNKELKAQLAEATSRADEAEAKLSEQSDKYLRLAAEYDNYRRRSAKERDGIYGDAYADALKKLMPLIDNLERTSAYTDPEHIADGVKQTLKGLTDVLSSMGIEQYGEEGEKFDPNLHSAVSMVSDSGHEAGEIVSVFSRGYKYGDKIIRFAMVTVAGE
ncbi:MAG: nucleotide exchange factor GrpE [Firmicutes bacterium]|nr:nucleotide exchange factor GrpE [Bacillota bacterium]